ncbi:BTB/POZ domain protein [Ancylostoma caninum]|uniref:BTB/POZ domain protein n=1 Tax=Ancylostoma caninum TaxID=29170 RepID=A0A368GW94_ANCCA|nr:BTB/POZ domain protein [Ancylostoma caninum]
MSATFTQDVEDKEWTTVSTTPKIETSLKVGGVDWVFKVQKRAIEGTPHVGFTLVCGSKLKSALWRIAANVKLIIKKKNGTEKFVERSYPNNEFTFASKTLADMIPWDEIDTTLACSNKENSKSPVTLSFELQIDITKSYGFRRRARFEYSFFEPSYETDMILKVENRELYVNATYLAMLSPFFRSLQSKNMSLYGEIPTETINDVSLEDFLELLHVVYPSEKRVTVENVEMLLKLGDRYNFESVLVKCEDFLVTPKADDIDVFTRLEWASKYAMADLQDHCVSKLNSAQDIGAVKKTLLYGSLSHETRKLLLELMLKFSNM